ncbi:EF-hand domain-containing protein [Vreelandella populi]|uniref:EF-hand domain-containing protein n=1 Tax=Vreelandella populi TaxID=2498858 RepID=UPI000F8D7F2C|nr:EF-hand domain-containing protein [Halomonas populi]RUR51531.1 hypothetical protein ELY40_17190 [Halomonas populi]
MAQRFVTEFVINGDASGGVRAFEDTQRSADKLNQSMQAGAQRTAEYTQGIGSASRELQMMGRVIAPLSALVAGMFTAGALKNSIDFGDHIQKLNIRLGASTEALSEYNFVASLSGVQMNELSTAWQRQTRRINEAATGTGVASKALQTLGLDAKELTKLAPEEQFERIAQAMLGIEDAGERVRLAQKVWDSGGVKLLQIVDAGTEGIAQMREQARALGLTMSNETANSFAGFNDQVDILKFSAQGLAQTLLAEIVPGLTSTMQATNDLIQDLGGAEAVVSSVKDGSILLSGVLAGRLVGSLGASTVAMGKKIAADRAAALQAAAVAQQERETALATARRAEAEKVAALNSARISQQRAQAAQAEAAAKLREITVNQELMASERALETQRLKAQISATGRQQSLARLAEIRRTEMGLVSQSAAAQKALQAAELQTANSTRALTAAKIEATRAATASNAALAASTGAANRATGAHTALAGAARMSRLAMAPLGGPLGVAAAAATAFFLFRDSSDDVSASLVNLEDPLDRVIGQFKEMNEEAQQASLIRWGDKAEEEADKATSALGKIRQEIASLSGARIFGGRDEEQYQGYRRLLEDINAVGEGARNLTEVLTEAQEYMEIPDEVLRKLRLLAAEYAEHDENSQQATETLASLQQALREVADAADNAGDSVNDGAPSKDAIDKWEKYNDQLRSTIENLKDPSLLGQTNRALDAMEIFDPVRRATTIMLEQQKAQLEAEKKAQEAAATAARRTAETVQREAQRINDAYESQVAGLEQQIALFSDTTDAAKLRYELEHGKLKGLAPAQKAYLLQLREELDLKEKQAKATADFKKRTDDLISTYDRQAQQAKKLKADIEAVNAAYADPAVTMSAEQHARMLAEIEKQQYQLALESETTFAAMATAWENSVQRMDDAGVQFWRGFLDGTGNALDQFKRLVTDSVAEVAHALITKPLVVGLTTDLSGAFGFGPGGKAAGGLNFANTLSAGKNLWSSAGSLFGGGASTAASGGLYGAANTGAAVGGLYGNVATTAGAGASGGFMAGASAAMPWIGAGLLADNVLGLGITDGIVKGIGKLFGGGKTNPHLNIDTRADAGSYGHESVRAGAFGAVGFGQGTRRSNDLFGGIPEEREFLAALAASDDLLASLARSPEELDAMASAVQGVRLSASSVDGVMAQLSNRTVAAVSAIDGEFGAFVGSLGGDVDTIIARTQSAMGALTLLGDASHNLNLQFDASAAGALRAADNIAQYAGGIDQLASLQDSYYQSYFSEAERAANLQRDVTRAMAEMGYAMPATRDGYRQLVEQQNRFTEAGQRNYVQLLELAGPFDQLQTMLGNAGDGVGAFADQLAALNDQISTLEADVRAAYRAFDNQSFKQQITLLEMAGDSQAALALQRERELLSIDPLLHETQRVIWSIEDEAQAKQNATQAAQRYVSELSRVRDQLSSTFGNIAQWVDQRNATSGAPGMNLAEAGDQFARQLILAQSGDRSALQSITQYADQYLAAGEAMYASGGAYQRIQQDVLDALQDLPEQISAEQFLADEIRDALQSVVISAMPTDERLATQLSRELIRLDTNQLTHAQVRAALSPIASDAEISRLIREVDANGDGIITQQELANLRLGGLASGIGSTLAPMFDAIDLDASGLIDWNEFYSVFAGMASDEELRRIFNKLDVDGSGTISRLEALGHTSEGTEDNTKNLEERARDQLSSLDGLVGEMTRTTDQFMGLNSNIVSLRDSINALGIAQEEVARIERERAEAEARQYQRIEIQRSISGFESASDRHRDVAQSLANSGRIDPRNISNINALVDKHWNNDGQFSHGEWERVLAHLSQVFGHGSLEYNYGREYAAMYRNRTRANENWAQLDRLDGSHATGLWNVPFDGYIAELHRDEMVVPAQTASRLRELPAQRALPMPNVPLPQFPALDNGDMLQVLKDVQHELVETRKQNKTLHDENARLLAAANAQRGNGALRQIEAIKEGNSMLKRMQDDAVLEGARR